MDFADRVQDAVRGIPPGRVASYGAIAAIAGQPRSARAVGRLMREIPEGSDVPWWRVVTVRGEISIPRSGHARTLQRVLLEDDGVPFGPGGRVDMRAYGWPPEEEE